MRTNSVRPGLDRVKELLTVTGATIRPGGFELTERGEAGVPAKRVVA